VALNLDRWNDERLDDLAADVRSLNRLPERMSLVERELINVSKDTQEVLERVKAEAAERRKDRQNLLEREKLQARERKKDRQWLVGTGLAASSLVVAAGALLSDKV